MVGASECNNEPVRNFYMNMNTHLRGVELNFWHRDWLSRQVFRRCPQHLAANAGIIPEIRPQPIPQFFQFIIK